MLDKITKHPHKLLFDSLNLIKRAFLVQKFYAHRYKKAQFSLCCNNWNYLGFIVNKRLAHPNQRFSVLVFR